jgi:hypothetical protein
MAENENNLEVNIDPMIGNFIKKEKDNSSEEMVLSKQDKQDKTQGPSQAEIDQTIENFKKQK